MFVELLEQVFELPLDRVNELSSLRGVSFVNFSKAHWSDCAVIVYFPVVFLDLVENPFEAQNILVKEIF